MNSIKKLADDLIAEVNKKTIEKTASRKEVEVFNSKLAFELRKIASSLKGYTPKTDVTYEDLNSYIKEASSVQQ